MHTIDATEESSRVLRPLGAFEQVFHLYIQHNPTHFCIPIRVAGPADLLGTERLASALARLQTAHPQLAAAVADGTADDGGSRTAVFRRSDAFVPLAVLPAGTRWEDVVADEQTRRFDAEHGPLWRATLIPDETGGGPDAETVGIVLTFDHRITDGVGGMRAASDLVRLLDGQPLDPEPVPVVQEQLLRDRAAGPPGSPPPPGDPRLTAPGALRPFDAVRPEVTSRRLDQRTTAALIAATHEHGTSVQGALCAAASQVLAGAGRDYIRINTPIDLRRNLGLPDAVALRMMPSLSGRPAEETTDFWSLARAVADDLIPPRSLEGVLTVSGAIESTVPADADGADAWMLAVSSLDMMLTNLGVVEPPATSTVRLVDIGGLGMSIRMAGEQIVGAVTFGGSLRMLNVAHDPVPGLLDLMTAVLLKASGLTEVDPVEPSSDQPQTVGHRP